MPMSSRRRNQRRQTLDQFERSEHQADAAAGTWLDAFIDQVFGVDFTQALEREGRASAVAQQTFQARVGVAVCRIGELSRRCRERRTPVAALPFQRGRCRM